MWRSAGATRDGLVPEVRHMVGGLRLVPGDGARDRPFADDGLVTHRVDVDRDQPGPDALPQQAGDDAAEVVVRGPARCPSRPPAAPGRRRRARRRRGAGGSTRAGRRASPSDRVVNRDGLAPGRAEGLLGGGADLHPRRLWAGHPDETEGRIRSGGRLRSSATSSWQSRLMRNRRLIRKSMFCSRRIRSVESRSRVSFASFRR